MIALLGQFSIYGSKPALQYQPFMPPKQLLPHPFRAMARPETLAFLSRGKHFRFNKPDNLTLLHWVQNILHNSSLQAQPNLKMWYSGFVWTHATHRVFLYHFQRIQSVYSLLDQSLFKKFNLLHFFFACCATVYRLCPSLRSFVTKPMRHIHFNQGWTILPVLCSLKRWVPLFVPVLCQYSFLASLHYVFDQRCDMVTSIDSKGTWRTKVILDISDKEIKRH